MSARLGRFGDKARHDILLVQSLIFFVVASACALSQPADPDGIAPQTTASPQDLPLWPATNAEPAISDQASVPTTKAEAAVSPKIVPVDEVNTYLWRVYQRSSTKIDGHGDFTWKDIVAADVWGLSMKDYVVGGMDADFRELLFAAGRAMDMAGIDWTILSGFRDDFRQALASGFRARGGNSFHGGSAATGGYGHGCAADLASSDGLSDNKVWNWLDRHSQQFGLHRPLPGADPAHVLAGWRQMAEKLRDERRAAASDTDRGSEAATEPDSIFSRAANSFLLSDVQFTCSHARQVASTSKAHNVIGPIHPTRTSVSKEHHTNSREKVARDHTHSASSGRSASKGRVSRSHRAGEIPAGASSATLPTTSAASGATADLDSSCARRLCNTASRDMA
jgi:hypothetical protein